MLRPGVAHRVVDLERPAHAIFQASAIFVVAAVGERCDEGRQQIAMRHMQLDHVEAGALGHFGSLHEFIAHAVHVGPRHRFRGCIVFRPGNIRRGQQVPVVLFQRRVGIFPAKLRRAFCTCVADLHADLGAGLGMHEIDDAFPCCLVLGRIGAGAAGRDAALGRNAGHLGVDEAGAALGALAIMNEVPVGRAAVDGLVLRHGRDNDAVFQLHVAQLEGREHRMPHGCIG